MSVSNAWDESKPADGDVLSQGDDEIRKFKLDVRQRMQAGGVLCADSVNTDGLHAVNAGGAGVGPDIYKSDKATKLLSFTNSSVDAGTGVNITGGNVTSGTDPGHLHTGAIAIQVPGALLSGRIKASFRVPVRASLTLSVVKVSIVVFTAPTAAVLRVNIVRIQNPLTTTDRTTGGTSIFTATGDRPAIAIGQFSASATANISNGVFNAGDEFVAEIDSTGFASAADLTIQVDVT